MWCLCNNVYTMFKKILAVDFLAKSHSKLLLWELKLSYSQNRLKAKLAAEAMLKVALFLRLPLQYNLQNNIFSLLPKIRIAFGFDF